VAWRRKERKIENLLNCLSRHALKEGGCQLF
jgi:hypothetical protein